MIGATTGEKLIMRDRDSASAAVLYAPGICTAE